MPRAGPWAAFGRSRAGHPARSWWQLGEEPNKPQTPARCEVDFSEAFTHVLRVMACRQSWPGKARLCRTEAARVVGPGEKPSRATCCGTGRSHSGLTVTCSTSRSPPSPPCPTLSLLSLAAPTCYEYSRQHLRTRGPLRACLACPPASRPPGPQKLGTQLRPRHSRPPRSPQ